MSLNNQPVRGIIPVLCVIISSIIFIGIGQSTFGINPDMLSVYALFFVWTAFIVSLAGDGPLVKIRQPLRGISYLTICLVIGRLFNIFWDCQNLPLISLAIDCNQYKTRK